MFFFSLVLVGSIFLYVNLYFLLVADFGVLIFVLFLLESLYFAGSWGSIVKDSLPFYPTHGVNQDMVKSSCANLRLNQRLDLWKPMSRLLAGNPFVRILSTVGGPVQDDHLNSALFSFGIAEQCTRQDKILKYLRSGSNDVESSGINMSILFDLMGPLAHAIDMHQQQFASYLEQQSQPSLVYPKLVSGARAGVEMKDILSIISEFYFSKDSMKCTKHAMLVPYFDRKTCKIKAKGESSVQKLDVNAATLGSIAGTGIAVLFSVACKLACGRIVFSALRLLNTGLGLGLIWLSWAVNNLRDTVVVINRSSGKLDVIEEDMMNNLDKNVKEIYFRAAILLAVVVLRLA
ncbi:hypothetical protein K7X08_032781 [Anisodus acutangulus]|uniref:Transmembrane protein n=1 Tax=Anisodus acutangulus TaxID=402998 RepID=A0A9Q1RBD8_9SOLA|nr:hypothetical protein K7X08_032781 [Anisodus acutangulus]